MLKDCVNVGQKLWNALISSLSLLEYSWWLMQVRAVFILSNIECCPGAPMQLDSRLLWAKCSNAKYFVVGSFAQHVSLCVHWRCCPEQFVSKSSFCISHTSYWTDPAGWITRFILLLLCWYVRAEWCMLRMMLTKCSKDSIWTVNAEHCFYCVLSPYFKFNISACFVCCYNQINL